MKRTSAGRPVAAPRVRELLDSPFVARKFDRELEVCEVAKRFLSFCRYRHAAEHFCYARASSRLDVLGLRRGRSSFFAVDLAHPSRWHEEVHRRGLSGASGRFVFGAGEGLEGGALVVLTARQGSGCSLRLSYAVARQEGGAWRPEWDGPPAEYRVPPAMPPVAEDDYYRLALWRRIGQSLL